MNTIQPLTIPADYEEQYEKKMIPLRHAAIAKLSDAFPDDACLAFIERNVGTQHEEPLNRIIDAHVHDETPDALRQHLLDEAEDWYED